MKHLKTQLEFNESKTQTMVKKELGDILDDISKCSGEDGMKKLVKLQSLWDGMTGDKLRNKVLKSIKKRLDEIGY
jgi:hypothetical protein